MVHDLNHDFSRPLFTSFSFFVAGLTKRFPTAEEQRMFEQLLSQTWQTQFDLNVCPYNSLYSTSVFKGAERLFPIDECLRYFFDDDETIFYPSFVGVDCNKQSIPEAKTYFQLQHPQTYNPGSSTSSSIALVNAFTV
jgi:hypothetical protein